MTSVEQEVQRRILLQLVFYPLQEVKTTVTIFLSSTDTIDTISQSL